MARKIPGMGGIVLGAALLLGGLGTWGVVAWLRSDDVPPSDIPLPGRQADVTSVGATGTGTTGAGAVGSVTMTGGVVTDPVPVVGRRPAYYNPAVIGNKKPGSAMDLVLGAGGATTQKTAGSAFDLSVPTTSGEDPPSIVPGAQR